MESTVGEVANRSPASAPGLSKTLAELRRRLERLLGPDLLELRLFGSHARGEAQEESDVDVLVVIPEPSWEMRRRGRTLEPPC